MKVNGEKSFWGKDVGLDLSDEQRKLLGVNTELQTPGKNAKQTAEREQAHEITLEFEMAGETQDN